MRLVVGLAEVGLHLQQRLRGRFELHDLPCDQGLEGVGHDLDHGDVLKTGEEDGSARQKVVTSEHHHLVA